MEIGRAVECLSALLGWREDQRQRGDTPHLVRMCDPIRVDDELVNLLTDAFEVDRDGKTVPSGVKFPELGRLREEMKQARMRVVSVMNELVGPSSALKGKLLERRYDELSGRFVVPVSPTDKALGIKEPFRTKQQPWNSNQIHSSSVA